MTETVFIWRPEPLTARLIAAARPAAFDVAKAAAVRAPHPGEVKMTGAGETFTVGSSDTANAVFERGSRPHEIAPKKKVLSAGKGKGFVAGGAVRHPGMRARPWLRPTLPLWPVFYRLWASRVFRGF